MSVASNSDMIISVNPLIINSDHHIFSFMTIVSLLLYMVSCNPFILCLHSNPNDQRVRHIFSSPVAYFLCSSVSLIRFHHVTLLIYCIFSPI